MLLSNDLILIEKRKSYELLRTVRLLLFKSSDFFFSANGSTIIQTKLQIVTPLLEKVIPSQQNQEKMMLATCSSSGKQRQQNTCQRGSKDKKEILIVTWKKDYCITFVSLRSVQLAGLSCMFSFLVLCDTVLKGHRLDA